MLEDSLNISKNRGSRMSTTDHGRKIEMTVTNSSQTYEASNGQLSISLPINLKRRSGRQRIRLPDGSQQEPYTWDAEPTPLQQALARGHRWLQLLESGKCDSLKAIAEREGVDNSYVSRMINLTILAPDIVEAILDDRLPPTLTLFDLAVDPPRLWCEQRVVLSKECTSSE